MELPQWPEGTVAVLATSGEGPHAIPVSAVVRAGPRRVLLALAGSRGSLARLRADSRVALCILAAGVAASARGRATVLDEALVDGVAAVEVEVDEVIDHDRPTFEIQAGVAWRWTDSEAKARDARVRRALGELA